MGDFRPAIRRADGRPPLARAWNKVWPRVQASRGWRSARNLVRQAALHKNVLLPAKERSEEALNFGGTQEITAGSRARMQVRAVRERERASNEPSPGQLDL